MWSSWPHSPSHFSPHTLHWSFTWEASFSLWGPFPEWLAEVSNLSGPNCWKQYPICLQRCWSAGKQKQGRGRLYLARPLRGGGSKLNPSGRASTPWTLLWTEGSGAWFWEVRIGKSHAGCLLLLPVTWGLSSVPREDDQAKMSRTVVCYVFVLHIRWGGGLPTPGLVHNRTLAREDF